MGKSTICQRLLGQTSEVVLLEGDLLWRSEFDTPDDNYRDFFETWLRLAKSIVQSGRPVVLFNAGAIPENVEPCVERRYFTKVHYLALVCDDDILAERLRCRPSWRNSDQPAFIESQRQFNRWCKENAHKISPAMTLLDVKDGAIEETASQVESWI